MDTYETEPFHIYQLLRLGSTTSFQVISPVLYLLAFNYVLQEENRIIINYKNTFYVSVSIEQHFNHLSDSTNRTVIRMATQRLLCLFI